MRILHVVPSYWPAVRYGGPIFAVHSLCRALARLGHDVEVFTTNIDGAGVSNVPIEVPVTLDGVRIRYFSAERWRRLYWAPRLGQALKQDVGHVDVVHAHSVFLWPTWAASHFSRRADVPYLISPRGMLVKEMVERRSRLAKRIWIELFEKKNLKMAAAIHATSALEATELQRFGWRLPRIAVIPNVVDQPDDAVDGSISRDVREAAAGLPFALFLGRISWKKGLDRLYAHSHAYAWADWSLLDQTTSFCCRNLYGSLVNCKCPIVFTFLPVPCPGRTRPTSTAQHSYSSCRHIPKISAIPFSKPCNTPSRSSLRRKWVRQKSFAKQNAV